MRSEVTTWLKKKLSRRRLPQQKPSHLEEEREPDIPCLTSTRRHALSPSPSSTELLNHSPFFDKLPPEIRRRILVQAFGDRTMHMDFSLIHPIAVAAPGKRPPSSHAGINANIYTSPPLVHWDLGAPRSWQWRSCVCHRSLPDHLSSPIDRIRGVQEPGADQCLNGGPHHCKAWPGEYPLKCKIGIMGWILSCRQA